MEEAANALLEILTTPNRVALTTISIGESAGGRGSTAEAPADREGGAGTKFNRKQFDFWYEKWIEIPL